MPKPKKDEQPGNPDDEGESTADKLKRFSPVLIPLVIALVASYFMISSMGVPKATYNSAAGALTVAINDIATLKTQIQGFSTGGVEASLIENTTLINQLKSRVDALELPGSVATPDLSGYAKITDLADYATKTNILGLIDSAGEINAIITGFDDRIADMEETLAELELISASGEAIITEESTLWGRELYTTYPTSVISITYTVSPSKIEEDGDYIIMVYLSNYDLTAKSDVIVDLILSPKTGDRVKVDEAEIYLDSTRSPFYGWFAQIVKRSDGTCRRIVFSSEHIAINAGEEVAVEGGTAIAPGRLTLRLELTLAYK